jgi:hypothetical protein
MGQAVPLRLRVRVWLGSLALDTRLAEGASLYRSPELTLRARQLASNRVRLQLSDALTHAIDAATHPARSLPASPIAASGVLAARRSLLSLAWDLRSIPDPPVRGVALASFLVCDPTSPLYNRHSPVTVRELADRARSAFEQAVR